MEKWILEGVFFGETRCGVVRGRNVTFFDGSGELGEDSTSLDGEGFRGTDSCWTEISASELPTAEMREVAEHFLGE